MRALALWLGLALAPFGAAADGFTAAGGPVDADVMGVAPPAIELDAGTVEDNESVFRAKLDQLLERIEKSVAITREQISSNPGAPFIPDLYLQLGELLAQKADASYYLEMERRKKQGGDLGGSEPMKADQVARAIQEAAQILKLIDGDFPTYAKRPKVLLMLAAAQKMSGQKAAFKATAARLFKEFPTTLEAAKARLLLAEMYFDIEAFDDCLEILQPLVKSAFAYERNAAKYKSALVYVRQEKFKTGLENFAEVARDPELDAPEKTTKPSTGQDLIQGGGRINLKREALLDSIRAYTQIFPRGERDPIPYYSDLAPTELYFQEVIEKLAYRYISIKEIRTGVRLLRTLSERLREPQRVVRIYIDVLARLTPEDRWRLEPAELAYVLENLRTWLTFYQLEAAFRKKTEELFEKQARELGTAAHDKAKVTRAEPARGALLERAARYYELYLAYFRNTKFRVKMAMNLADVYYLQKNMRDCGSWYLRVFQNEFGPREETEKVVQNAILCLQADKSESFYAQVRARGLLIKAIKSYQNFKPATNNDPQLGFALLKAQYDQGAYAKALDGLHQFMRKFRSLPQAVSAGELILDYHNTRMDLAALKTAAERMLSYGLTDAKFNLRLQTMRKQVALKKLYERVDTASSRADSSRGETYLQAAMSSGDEAVKDVALQQALASSRAEGNIDVYLRTAGVLLAQAKSSETKAQLAVAVISENLKVTRFYRALAHSESLAADVTNPAVDRERAWVQAANLVLALRDPAATARLMAKPDWARTSSELKARIGVFLAELLDGRSFFSETSLLLFLNSSPTDEVRSALYRRQFSVSGETRKAVLAAIENTCAGKGDSGSATACAWLKLGLVEPSQTQLLAELRTTQIGIQGLEKLAKKLEGVTAQYATLEGTGDPHLDTIRLVRVKEIYAGFAAFLTRLAMKNADLKTLLLQKAGEAQTSSGKSRDACTAIASQVSGQIPAASACGATVPTSYPSLLHWSLAGGHSWSVRTDPGGARLGALQKKLFVNAKDPDALLELAVAYLNGGHANLAMATALLGSSSAPDRAADFEAVQACASGAIGLARESGFHLKKASDFGGLKARCAKGGAQ